ncbi:metallo-endopeptidase [Microbacterium phage Alex44]|uniref:Lysin A n=1 Tax=Microbacterium phage Alex44 TaxID=2590877 RepID=A0A4Y6EB99_9CAUD|nr:metallo-endopeptidase [Microbacterium phage Alex44]QDF15948.1 lysin A [Microbacterium phage Alex44]
MADVKGGYLRPTPAGGISSSWQAHKDRRPPAFPGPSQEPGTDIACAYGTTLVAPEDGVVVEIKTSNSNATGRFVTIDLNDGRRVRYLHLSAVLVNSGARVTRGQAVARSGASANGRDWGVGAHVHVTLWDFHRYVFGPNGTMDFMPQIGADNDGGGLTYSQEVANQQAWMNQARGEKLVVDGYRGGFTIAAIKRYQTFLGVKADGVWGANTQAAHQKYYDSLQTPAPSGHVGGVNDLASIGDVRGLQKIAKLYGYAGRIDNDWGDGSKRGFQRFLDQNYGGSLATWLRSKWGYKDADNIWGPNMKAAAARASVANMAAL